MVWKSGDWLPLPATAKTGLSEVNIVHKTDTKITVDTKVTVNGEEVTVAHRKVEPKNPKIDVLLLHGMKFKSQTWVDDKLCTLQILCNLGYRAVAIDLPGYGDSPHPKNKVEPAAYMAAVIKELGLHAPVIVSPSMSGAFALPYLFEKPSEVTSRCRGFVPVAPVHTEAYTVAQYETLNVPSLIVHGENDRAPHAPVSLENLRNLPNSVVDIIQGAGHACYLDNPDVFHSHLYTFLSSL